ncbi:DNA-binding NarL/FixJ family response regulator [Kitasatospora sp. MAP12-15]|uniref:helix-turn-helix transcriptional regulator n=1 Tax=unclassified Kitasatospora TaxID=2633591 RepID=UPI0024752843|nr:response regulator transcription factor [Kitasatospora sp. MAP12-44]MDH6113632.1 DNA-binding NarL/FixJ family response regulator [Kitasatospora sp. MAP12-44]
MSVQRIAVRIQAEDPISQSGVVAQLRTRPELRLVEAADTAEADAVLVIANSLDPQVVAQLRGLQRTLSSALVLVVSALDDAAMATAVECGVVGLVRRSEATADQLVRTLGAAVRGEGAIPPDLLGRLLQQMGRLQRQILDPRGLSFSGLHQREIDVLKLVSEGHDTREIAEQLAYSERTVKNVLHDVTSRLQLRNRTHAVAYAMRQGLI